MCSFLVTTLNLLGLKLIKEKKGTYKLTKKMIPRLHLNSNRGPDGYPVSHTNQFYFIHHLLHITGNKTYQPFWDPDNEVAVVFNGEIYNYAQLGDYPTDGECLIPTYLKEGIKFTQHLDGEFAIVLIDFKNKILLISSDVFGTKPIYYSHH